MKLQITALFSFAFSLFLASDIRVETEKSRKHYGMSYHVKCDNYVKSFTCMSACKSIGFQVFRMDTECKCSCHELKTTTILPFFKWLTNGTTVQWHKTQSVPLYHVVGTLSPPTYIDYNALDEGTGPTEAGDGAGQATESGATGGSGATTSGDGAGATGEGGDAPDAAAGGDAEAEGEADGEAEGEGEPDAEAEPEALEGNEDPPAEDEAPAE